MELIWALIFIIAGIVYIIKGYQIHTHKRPLKMSEIYVLTSEQQEAMIPIIVPYYISTGVLLIATPILQRFLGNIILLVLIAYLFIGALRISKKRSEYHRVNELISSNKNRTT